MVNLLHGNTANFAMELGMVLCVEVNGTSVSHKVGRAPFTNILLLRLGRGREQTNSKLVKVASVPNHNFQVYFRSTI